MAVAGLLTPVYRPFRVSSPQIIRFFNGAVKIIVINSTRADNLEDSGTSLAWSIVDSVGKVNLD